MLYWPVKSILTCAYTLYVYIHATCAQHFDIIYVYIYISLYIYILLKGWCYFRESWNGSSQCWFDFKYVSFRHVPRKIRSIHEYVFFLWYISTTYWALLGIDQNFQLKGPWTFLRISTYFHTENNASHLHEWQLKFIDAWENSLNQYVAASLEIWTCFTTSLGIEYPRTVEERLLV